MQIIGGDSFTLFNCTVQFIVHPLTQSVSKSLVLFFFISFMVFGLLNHLQC